MDNDISNRLEDIKFWLTEYFAGKDECGSLDEDGLTTDHIYAIIEARKLCSQKHTGDTSITNTTPNPLSNQQKGGKAAS